MALTKVHDQRGSEIAKALDRIATQLKYLGNGDAADGGMGAIENLASVIESGMGSVCSALGEIDSSIDRK